MKVIHFTRYLKKYRVWLHDKSYSALKNYDIEYFVFYSNEGGQSNRADNGHSKNSKEVKVFEFKIKSICLNIQMINFKFINADLVIITQASSNLTNLIIILLRYMGIIKRIAFWGHSKNYQGEKNYIREYIKSKYSLLCDWWFVYTDDGRNNLIKIGFPDGKITVLNNTPDTYKISNYISYKKNLNNKCNKVRAVFIGSIYPGKDIEFILNAGIIMSNIIDNFELSIVGGGDNLEYFSKKYNYDFIKFCGPLFDEAKFQLLSTCKVMLLPKLVNLSVVDSFYFGVPIVTTLSTGHGPEFSYLTNLYNSIILSSDITPEKYAEAVQNLLLNNKLYNKIKRNCELDSDKYTSEKMLNAYITGIISCINNK